MSGDLLTQDHYFTVTFGRIAAWLLNRFRQMTWKDFRWISQFIRKNNAIAWVLAHENKLACWLFLIVAELAENSKPKNDTFSFSSIETRSTMFSNPYPATSSIYVLIPFNALIQHTYALTNSVTFDVDTCQFIDLHSIRLRVHDFYYTW